MKTILFIHRWTGVVLALFMALWLGSGLVIILSDPPAADRAAQLAHAERLPRQDSWLDPADAWARGGLGELPSEARLVRIADGVYWLFRPASGEALALSAIDGRSRRFGAEDAVKIADAWLSAAGDKNIEQRIVYLDQGEAPAFVRNGQGLCPCHRLAVADGKGTEVIVSALSGETLAVSSATSRALYFAGSWIHTLHPLDFLGETRRTVLAWTGVLAAVACLSEQFNGCGMGASEASNSRSLTWRPAT